MTDPAVSVQHNRPNLFARIWNQRGAYLYIFPTIGLLLLFMYYPALSALFHAFFKWDQFGDVYWIGLDNFRQLYQQLFTARPGVEGFYGMVQLVAWGAMGLLVAFFLLTEALREKSWAIPRTLAAAPTVIVAVVAGAGFGLVPAFEVGELIGAGQARSLQNTLLAALVLSCRAGGGGC
jgi:ABC-type sugar transport system permease subunit